MVERTTNNFKFPGQYYIEETNLYYNWWRWYDTIVSNYTQVDSLIKVNNNNYAYAFSNPVLYVDIKGLESCKQITDWINYKINNPYSVRYGINWKIRQWYRTVNFWCVCIWQADSQTKYIHYKTVEFQKATFRCYLKCNKFYDKDVVKKISEYYYVDIQTEPILINDRITEGFMINTGEDPEGGDTCHCPPPID